MAIVNQQTLKIAGKIGNKVYYNVKGEQRVRAYAIPIQPGTATQQSWWRRFRHGVRLWQHYPQTKKDEFNKRAIRYQMSGFNLHMKEYLPI